MYTSMNCKTEAALVGRLVRTFYASSYAKLVVPGTVYQYPNRYIYFSILIGLTRCTGNCCPLWPKVHVSNTTRQFFVLNLRNTIASRSVRVKNHSTPGVLRMLSNLCLYYGWNGKASAPPKPLSCLSHWIARSVVKIPHIKPAVQL
jgi:hypothetical protein